MIYINGRFLSQKITGVNRFAFEICKGLQRLNIDFTVIVPKSIVVEANNTFKIIRYGSLTSHLWEQIDLPRFLKSQGSPLLVSFSGLGPVFYRNQIFTIHDLSFYVEPKWFSLAYRTFYRFFTPLVAKTAKSIITVSEFSKREIIKYLKINEDKIKVIYNAVSVNFEGLDNADCSSKFSKGNYILAVSSLDPRKNYDRLIEAFDQMSSHDCNLLLVGKSAAHFNFNPLSGKNEKIKFLGYVSDDDLITLYKNASIFIYPSLYEGFGIPPLEAMSNGCPVVASDIESIKEICGEAVYYINPLSIESIASGLRKVLENNDLRKSLIAKGMNRVRDFSWDDSASEVAKIIFNLTKLV